MLAKVADDLKDLNPRLVKGLEDIPPAYLS